MGRLNVIVDDFRVGEVSPLTEARISSSEFRDGLREALNVVPDAHGPMMGRPGFEFIDEIDPNTDLSATLFQITFSQVQYYVIVLTDMQIRIYDIGGQQILDAAIPHTGVELHGADGLNHYYKAVQAPTGNTLIIVGPDHPPYKVVFDLGNNTASVSEVVFEDDAQTPNMPPEWSATPGNYPTTVTFYQARSWWSGCKDDPSTLWSSKSNFYFDMTAGTAADDGIIFQIARQGQIRWLEGSKNLLAGTDFNEFIFEAESGVLQPGDIRVERQSSFGSCWIQPRMIGNEVMYITSDFRKLRTMWYRILDVGGWSSRDATFTAEHITEVQPVHMCFARNPFSVVMLTLANGEVACCTYFRQENGEPSVGWYRMGNDHFRFRSLCAPERQGRSEIWAIATDETGKMHLLRKTMRNYQDDTEVFLDNYKTLDYSSNPTATPSVSSISFFSNVVDVIADGFHYPDQVIQPNGTIELPQAHSIISVGHPYRQRIVTMPMIMKGEANNVGHQKKRWNKVFVRLLKSYRPKVNGDRPPERHVETNDDVAEPFVDGFVQVSPSGGWDRSGILTIEQDLPFRMLMTGIYGEFSSEQI